MYHERSPSRPQVSIPPPPPLPPGARQPHNNQPSPWAFEVQQPPPYLDPQDYNYNQQAARHNWEQSQRQRAQSMVNPHRPSYDNVPPPPPLPNRPSGSYFNGYRTNDLPPPPLPERPHSTYPTQSQSQTPTIAFPEPQIFRSVSAQPSITTPTPRPSHTSHLQSLGPHSHGNNTSSSGYAGQHGRRPSQNHSLYSTPSMVSLASTSNSSYRGGESDDYDYDDYESVESHGEPQTPSQTRPSDMERVSSDLDSLSIDGIQQFQSGSLPEKDCEWHMLVPKEAIEALGKSEVQRQSVIFEIIKSEREYVRDLECVRDVFIIPLTTANPPIITPQQKLDGFITSVFSNLTTILSHHLSILAQLFARQREQHPLIGSVADIILDEALKQPWRDGYEEYIKHYPFAESAHRRELKSNQAYKAFVDKAKSSPDPRVKKRDLITFLSRPVTRLPRVNLLLSQVLKLTSEGKNEDQYEGHPDRETIPVTLGLLGDVVKASQPGIEAAEGKVAFWGLCEGLEFRRGEIIDMDLYADSRSLVYSGPVSRRGKSGHGWVEGTCIAALLDNYFLITQEEPRPNGTIRRKLTSRPVSLSYLRLASFDGPPETRKINKQRSSSLSLFSEYETVQVYPFTIYHAANTLNSLTGNSKGGGRTYTLYVASEGVREKWKTALVDALGVHRVRQESNMFFDPQPITQKFFRVVMEGKEEIIGRVGAAVPFAFDGREFLAVSTKTGIYVGSRGGEVYRKAFNPFTSGFTTGMAVAGGRLIIHDKEDGSLHSYPLALLSNIALGRIEGKEMGMELRKTKERLDIDGGVSFFRRVRMGGIRGREFVIYASKKFLQSSLNLHVMEAAGSVSKSKAFKPFGDPGYVPKDAYDIVPLVKTIGICAKEGIVVVDPMNLSKSRISIVPDFSGASDNPPMQKLKDMIGDGKALGLVKSNKDELLVVVDNLGFYITKHGRPARQCGFIKWETKASSCAHQSGYILLFSSHFIEVREVTTGKLVQVVEGVDLRLLHQDSDPGGSIFVAMRGDGAAKGVDKIVEMKETREIGSQGDEVPQSAVLWDEWDM